MHSTVGITVMRSSCNPVDTTQSSNSPMLGENNTNPYINA